MTRREMRCRCQYIVFYGKWHPSYRSQHRSGELVRLLGPHQGTHLEHTDGQSGYDGGMLTQRLFQHLAVLVVVVKGANFGDATETLKGAQVQLVDVGEVRVGDDDVRQRLDVAQTVCYPAGLQLVAHDIRRTVSPGGQLESAVVGRIEQARLGEGTAKVCQLS
jgi:hypothetical protein